MEFPMDLDDYDPSEEDLEAPACRMDPKDMDALGAKLSTGTTLSGPCWEQAAHYLLDNRDDAIDLIRTYSQNGDKLPGVLLLKTWSEARQTRTMMVLRTALERCNRGDVMDCFWTAVRNMNRVMVHVVVKYPVEIPDVSGRLQSLREEIHANTSLRKIMKNRLEGELTEYEITSPKWANWTTPASKIKGDMVTITRVVCHETPLKSVVDPVMDGVVSSSTDTPKQNNLLSNIVFKKNICVPIKNLDDLSDTENESSLGDSLWKNISPLKTNNLSGKSNISDPPDVNMDEIFSEEQASKLAGCGLCYGRMREEIEDEFYVNTPTSPPMPLQVFEPRVVYNVDPNPRETHTVFYSDHINPRETHHVGYPDHTSPREIHHAAYSDYISPMETQTYVNIPTRSVSTLTADSCDRRFDLGRRVSAEIHPSYDEVYVSPRQTNPVGFPDHISPRETQTYVNIPTRSVSTPTAESSDRRFDLGSRVSSEIHPRVDAVTYVNIPTSTVSTPTAESTDRRFDLGRRVSSKTLVNRASRHLAPVAGWFDYLTQEQMDDLLEPHLNDDGWYIVWRMRGHNGQEALYVSVTHGGDKVHYSIRAREVNNRPYYYIFKEIYRTHDVERLINHYRREFIETKVNPVTGAVRQVQLHCPVVHGN